ncbi:hypothetical protein Ptr902_06060 [Pyrenophora tritici-repentis]|nr:hypothetical protein Ptr902_06060 [Pyrenophora tritici-repentis]
MRFTTITFILCLASEALAKCSRVPTCGAGTIADCNSFPNSDRCNADGGVGPNYCIGRAGNTSGDICKSGQCTKKGGVSSCYVRCCDS